MMMARGLLRMYSDFILANDRPAYIQVKDYMRRLITTGALQGDQKLPSTRELCYFSTLAVIP